MSGIDELRKKRAKYTSLEDFVKEEGVMAMLEFLSRNPTISDGVYRHTQIPVIPFKVEKEDSLFSAETLSSVFSDIDIAPRRYRPYPTPKDGSRRVD